MTRLPARESKHMSWQQVDWVETGPWWSTRLIVLFVLLGALLGDLGWQVNQFFTLSPVQSTWELTLNDVLILGTQVWVIVAFFVLPTARAIGFGYDRLLVDYGLKVREAPWAQVHLVSRGRVSLDYRTTVILTSRQMTRLLEILPQPPTPTPVRG